MAKNNEVTGAKAASAAAKVLGNPKSSPAAKSAAATVKKVDGHWLVGMAGLEHVELVRVDVKQAA